MERESWMDDIDRAVACCGKDAVQKHLAWLLSRAERKQRLLAAGYPEDAEPGTSLRGAEAWNPATEDGEWPFDKELQF